MQKSRGKHENEGGAIRLFGENPLNFHVGQQIQIKFDKKQDLTQKNLKRSHSLYFGSLELSVIKCSLVI